MLSVYRDSHNSVNRQEEMDGSGLVPSKNSWITRWVTWEHKLPIEQHCSGSTSTVCTHSSMSKPRRACHRIGITKDHWKGPWEASLFISLVSKSPSASVLSTNRKTIQRSCCKCTQALEIIFLNVEEPWDHLWCGITLRPPKLGAYCYSCCFIHGPYRFVISTRPFSASNVLRTEISEVESSWSCM